MRPVWVDGEGAISPDGRFYPESVIRAAVKAIADWWGALTDEEREAMRHLAHLAQIDRDVDAAVFGGAS